MNYSSLYNFYERIVFEYISQEVVELYPVRDEEFFLDVACYSLTRLPSRYIRHEIDMAFYLAPGERTEMQERVSEVVTAAAKFIDQRVKKVEP